ncbi:hypothetical protein A2U01_0060045, partial [Trifolium medium]|nr:hypothetical protein [Trifolium medium]
IGQELHPQYGTKTSAL